MVFYSFKVESYAKLNGVTGLCSRLVSGCMCVCAGVGICAYCYVNGTYIYSCIYVRVYFIYVCNNVCIATAGVEFGCQQFHLLVSPDDQ